VNRARADPIPIAVPDFGGDPLGARIAEVINADLARCGLFRPIPSGGFVQSGASDAGTPNFANWKVTGAQALVTGAVSGGGSVHVEFRLWDVLPEKQIQGTAYTTAPANWRRIAHIIADVIYERMLGEKGYFDTRIVYVSGTGPKDRRTKRLAIMDQDSENNRFLTDGGSLVLTPRFHPTRDEIAFMSFANSRPRVYTFDLGSGRQQVLGDFDGMTFAPRFAPDGGSVIMSVSRGGGAKRISYGSGRYATPVWSPRGDLIAFTRLGSSFAIGVMHPDGSGERILSESFVVDGPTFCPNGRVLMFWRETPSGPRGQGYSTRLVSVDITGFNERVVPTPTDASDPAWSPLAA
jgi:TolB protein